MSKPPLPDFVSDDTTSTPAIEPVIDTAPAVESTPEASPEAPGQPRGPDGKFAPVTPPAETAPAAAAPTPVPDAAPAAPAAPAPQPTPEAFAPIAALLDEREKRQAAEKRANELQQWRQEQEAKVNRPPVPTFAENPEAAGAHQAQVFDDAIYAERRNFSHRLAEMQHGKETVDNAFNWAAELIDQQLSRGGQSALNDAVRSNPDPVGFVVDLWKREQIVSKVDLTEYEAFQAWKAAQAAAPAAPQPPAAALAPAPPQAPAAPRPSLASAPSASTTSTPLPRDGASTFDAIGSIR